MARVSFLAVSILITLFAAFFLFDRTAPSGWTLYAFALFIIWMATYLIATMSHYRTLYLLTTAYVGPLAVFHLTWLVFDVLGEMTTVNVPLGKMADSYFRATWYSIVAFGALGIGMATMMLTQRQPPTTHDVLVSAKAAGSLDWIYRMGMGLLLASIVFFCMFVAAAGNPLQYSRAEFFETGVGGRGLGAFLMVFPGAVVTLLIGARKTRARVFAWSLAAFAFAVILISGYRSQAMYPLLVAVVLLSKCGRRIPISVALAGLAFLLIAIPVVGQIRQQSYEKIDMEVVEKSTEQASVAEGLATLGSTLGVLAKSIEVVPARAPFQNGYTYWVAIRDAMPNLSWTMDTSARAAALGNYAKGTKAIFDLPPGDWMTYIIDPQKFRIGHGVGFSAIAEPYVNFGFGGIVVFFLVVGLCFAWLDRVDMLRRPWILLLTSSTLWALLRTVRNSFGNFVKPLVFVLVVVVIWWMVLRIFGRNAVPARHAAVSQNRSLTRATLSGKGK